jgi:hypothetical protein
VARRVVDPDGLPWRVGREWMERSPRRSSDGHAGDRWEDVPTEVDLMLFSSASSTDLPGARPGALWLLVPIAPIVALVVGLPFLIVWFVAGPPGLAAVVLLLVAAVALVLRRRVWTVRARPRNRPWGYVWRVRGWASSTELVDVASEALRTGGPLPRGARRFGPPAAPLPRIGEQTD